MLGSYLIGNILVCALAGGIAGFLGHAMRVGRIATVGFVAAATMLASVGWRKYQQRPEAYDTMVSRLLANDSSRGMDRYLRHWAQSIGKYPEIRQWYDATPTMKRDEREQQSKLLTRAGLRRLSDRLLVQRLDALSKIVNSAEVKDCAGFGRGTITEAGMDRALDNMDDETLQRFSVVVAEAMAAELRQETPPRQQPMQEDITQAFMEMGRNIGVGAGQQLLTDMQRFTELPDDMACATTRVLYRQIVALKGRSQSTLALALVIN